MSAKPLIALQIVLALACGDDSAPIDSGTDSSAADAGIDSGNTDGATPDGAAPDTPGEDASSDGGTDAQVDAPAMAWTCPGALREVSAEAGDNILPAIEAAADAADEGDCLVLPMGEFSAVGTATITKKVSLLGHGAGDGGTWIRRPESTPDEDLFYVTMINYNIDSRESSNVLFAGFRLSSKEPQRVEGDGGSLATDVGLNLGGMVDFIITACRFEYFGYAGVQVEHFDDVARGLIYDNQFTHNLKGDGLGLGYGVAVYGGDQMWTDDPEFGTDNFIFVEDNNFTEHRHSLAGGGAGRYVVRHNDIIDNLWGAALDAHEGRATGLGSGNHFATRAVEAYDNILRNDHLLDGSPIGEDQNANLLATAGMGFRGGEQLVYNNQISGYLWGTLIIVFTSQPDEWDDREYPFPVPNRIS